jgi:Ricin-type beta-trefoil lectin domain
VPGKSIDDAGSSAENGTKVVIWTCNGSKAQQWTVRPDGTVRIHGKCLTVTGGSTASRNNVELWTWTARRASSGTPRSSASHRFRAGSR